MRSAFDDLSIFNVENLVGVFNGLESVSDNDDGTLFEELFHRFGDKFFAHTVKRGCRFIQKDDLWVSQKDLGDSKSLTLSSAQPYPLFSYLSIYSQLKIKNKLTLCTFQCLNEFFLMIKLFSVILSRILLCVI